MLPSAAGSRLVIIQLLIVVVCFDCSDQHLSKELKPLTEIYPEDSDTIKELKRLFNAVDNEGFKKYFLENNIPTNFVDSRKRGIFHWFALSDLHAAGIKDPTAVVPMLSLIVTRPDKSLSLPDIDGNIPLHYFASLGKTLPLQIHIDFNADVSARNKDGKTPLHMAAEKGFAVAVDKIIAGPVNPQDQSKRLRIDPRVVFDTDNKGYTALHYAAVKNNDQVAKALLGAVDSPEDLVNFVSPDVDDAPSAFQVAIAKNAFKVVRTFLELTSTSSLLLRPDAKGYLPLHLAVSYGHERIAELFLNKFAEMNRGQDFIYAPDQLGRNVLHHAARHGRREIMELILENTPEERVKERLSSVGRNKWTPLHYAARFGHDGVLDLILQQSKDDVNKVQSTGYTPLLLAAYGCQEDPDASIVRKLVRAGADKTATGPRPGETASGVCSAKGCVRCEAETAVTRVKPNPPTTKNQQDSQCSLSPTNAASSSVFDAVNQDRITPVTGKTCGQVRGKRRGLPCFVVEIFESSFSLLSTDFTSEARRPVEIGQGVLIDEMLVSTSASIFRRSNASFSGVEGNDAVEVSHLVRVGGARGSVIPVSGPPRIMRGGGGVGGGGADAAILELASPVPSTDSCFLCLPPRDYPPGCVESLQCTVLSTRVPGARGEGWDSYTASATSCGANQLCASAAAPFRPSAGAAGGGGGGGGGGDRNLAKWCAERSAALVCQAGNTAVLFGHQSSPEVDETTPGGQCGRGSSVQGVFTSLVTPAVNEFYRAAATGADEAALGNNAQIIPNNIPQKESRPSPFLPPLLSSLGNTGSVSLSSNPNRFQTPSNGPLRRK